MRTALWVVVALVVLLGIVVLADGGSKTVATRTGGSSSVSAREGVLDAGWGYVVALDLEGRVFGWGGYESNAGAKLLARGKRPKLLLAGSGYRRVAAGSRAIYVIDSEAVLRRAALSALGGDEPFNPVPIATAKRWRLARESWGVGAGIDRDGALWWWSDDEIARQLSGFQPEAVAQPQALMPGYRFIDACLQGPRLHAVDDQGRLWRSLDLQRRGSGDRPLQTEDGMLTRLEAAAGFTHVACRENASHVLALARDGSIWTYGINTFGETGARESDTRPDRTALDATTLTRIHAGPFIAVAVAPGVSSAIAADGARWGWGRNLDNELGNGGKDQAGGPEMIDNSRRLVALASTYDASVALDDQGVLQAWGSNAYGALGDGGIASVHDRPADVLTDIRFGGSQ